MIYNIRSSVIRWQIRDILSDDNRMFALSLTVFEILVYQMFDIESLGQGHRVQHSVANTKPL